MAVKLVGGGGGGGGSGESGCGGGGRSIGGGCGAKEVKAGGGCAGRSTLCAVSDKKMDNKRVQAPMLDKKSRPPSDLEEANSSFLHGSSQKIVQEQGPPARQAWQVGYQRKYHDYDAVNREDIKYLSHVMLLSNHGSF